MDGRTTTTIRPSVSTRLLQLRRRFAGAPWAATVEMAARLGYVARGVVYLSIGLIALLAVARLAPRPRGAVGALEAWGHWPMGVVLLWLIGLGLYGFAGWRVLQSVFDADRQGNSGKALASRAGQALSGLIYGGLAVSTFGLIDTIHDLHRANEMAAERATVAAVLAWPLGSSVVMATGAFIIACGLGNMARAALDDFGATLMCDPKTLAWTSWLARSGYFGRGLAMLPVGVFMLRAGWHEHAAEVKGIGGALWALHAQSGGDLVLTLVALGLMAFGAFALVEAWFRPIRPEAALESDLGIHGTSPLRGASGD
ncbi:DUF1206 domain-containing protein [Phenylobacterium sp.]|uniref:DUF1206 domain-containing protein n=1 Tax=Phenylobacterium sp. TaxID=1871053 RepID=UPI002F42531B